MTQSLMSSDLGWAENKRKPCAHTTSFAPNTLSKMLKLEKGECRFNAEVDTGAIPRPCF